MKKCLFLVLILYSVVVLGTEPVGNIYWIQFQSKANTPYSLGEPEYYLSPRAIERRNKHAIAIDSTDLPVNPAYVDSLKSLGFYVKHTSRWMNGAIVIPDKIQNIHSIVLPSFVKSIELRKGDPLKSTKLKFSDVDSLTAVKYGSSFTQVSMVGGQVLHNHSKGKGVVVGVIDAGFLNVNKIPAFNNLRSRNGILGSYDFVESGNSVYGELSHGTSVLSIMACSDEGVMIGSAPEADYWLLRSEDADTEFPVEEDYWIIAAEFADSVGCDVINTSLGYTTFDNPIFNHTYSEFDGKTMRISKAANLAVDKGIVVVCSAGNSGKDYWGHIVVPSEAEKVLCVAAVDTSKVVADFSSRGFTGEGFLPKPDISAMGADVSLVGGGGSLGIGSGTSFSSPVLAGFAACLVGAFPEKSASEIIEIIRKSGDRYPANDVEYGYGIPNFAKLFGAEIDTTTTTDTTTVNVINVEESNVMIYPNPFTNRLSILSGTSYNHFELISFEGKKVFSTSIHSSTSEISSEALSNLSKGVYFAVLKGDRKVKSLKLIKY